MIEIFLPETESVERRAPVDARLHVAASPGHARPLLADGRKPVPLGEAEVDGELRVTRLRLPRDDHRLGAVGKPAARTRLHVGKRGEERQARTAHRLRRGKQTASDGTEGERGDAARGFQEIAASDHHR